MSHATSALRGLALWALALVSLSSACVARNGYGEVSGELEIADCWSGAFDLEPGYLGAEAYRDTLSLRLQRDADFVTYADGLAILIRDYQNLRGSGERPSMLGQPLAVGLPPDVVPPGVPPRVDPTPPLVNMSLFLQKTCRTQNLALYAADEVLLADDGSCRAVPNDCTTPRPDAPKGHSRATFHHLFNGDILSRAERDRRIQGEFDVYLVDPREQCPGGERPPPCRGRLRGSFDYLYVRSRPYQPFP